MFGHIIMVIMFVLAIAKVKDMLFSGRSFCNGMIGRVMTRYILYATYLRTGKNDPSVEEITETELIIRKLNMKLDNKTLEKVLTAIERANNA